MIHPLLEILQAKIKTQFSEIKKIDYYKGEFEEGTDWNPIFPVVFTNCTTITPTRLSTEKALVGDMIVNIYCGIKIENEAHTALFENLILFLNNLNEDAELKQTYTFDMKPTVLLGYFFGIEAYRTELLVKKVIV